jgi:hypothetical protein
VSRQEVRIAVIPAVLRSLSETDRIVVPLAKVVRPDLEAFGFEVLVPRGGEAGVAVLNLRAAPAERWLDLAHTVREPRLSAKDKERMVRQAVACRANRVALAACELGRSLGLDGDQLAERLGTAFAILAERGEDTRLLLSELPLSGRGRATAVARRLHVSRSTYYRQVSRLCAAIYDSLAE